MSPLHSLYLLCIEWFIWESDTKKTQTQVLMNYTLKNKSLNQYGDSPSKGSAGNYIKRLPYIFPVFKMGIWGLSV